MRSKQIKTSTTIQNQIKTGKLWESRRRAVIWCTTEGYKTASFDSPYLKEDQAEYEFLLNSLIRELNLTSDFQECLVRKIANCLWRSRRIINAETGRINRQLGWVDNDLKYEFSRDPIPDELETTEEARIRMENNTRRKDNIIGISSIPEENFCVRILRYEMRLDRQMTRTYLLLRKLQSNNPDEEIDENSIKE